MTISRRTLTRSAAVAPLLAGAAACSKESKPTELVVFAAASLKEPFTELGKTFEADHADTKVVFSFGPSSGLSTQIIDGAPVDVFASAAQKQMDDVDAKGLSEANQVFARNALTLALAPGNPGKVTQAQDLDKPNVTTAACAVEVPCGTLAEKWFTASGVKAKVVTREVDVKAVLSKVSSGEVDAGLVYVSDAQAAKDKGVTAVELPEAPTTPYPIAVLKKAPHADLAHAFVDLVMSDQGAKVLADHGFGR